jgi:hypothetical protein
MDDTMILLESFSILKFLVDIMLQGSPQELFKAGCFHRISMPISGILTIGSGT